VCGAEEALASATVGPSHWFGLDATAGTIETGKLADMVLVRSNPYTRIRNVRDVIGVMIRGRYYSRSELARASQYPVASPRYRRGVIPRSRSN
jgi:imidazolonepropionase-like amidohydrolase